MQSIEARTPEALASRLPRGPSYAMQHEAVFSAAGEDVGSKLMAMKSRRISEPDAVWPQVQGMYERLRLEAPSETQSNGLLLCAFVIAGCAMHLEDNTQAERWARLSLSHVGPATPPQLRSRAHNVLGGALVNAARHTEAIGHLRRALALAQASNDAPLQASAANNLGGLLVLVGCHDDAIAVLTSALHMLGRRVEADLPPSFGSLLGNLAAAHADRVQKSARELDGSDLQTEPWARRDLVLARRYARRSIHLARRRGSTNDEGVAVLNLAETEIMLGQSSRALPWLLDLQGRVGNGEGKSALQVALMRVALAEGRVGEAAELFEPLQEGPQDATESIRESYLIGEVGLRRAQGRWKDACRALAEIEQRRRHRHDGALRERVTGVGEQCRRDDQQAMAFLAHDLRAPLQSLALLAVQPHSNERVQELAARAVRNIDLAVQRLPHDAADWSHPAAVFDLADALDAAKRSVVGDAQAAGVRLDVALRPGALVSGRNDVVERALVNLLLNAISVSAPGQSVRATIDEAAGGWSVCVSDAGPGLGAGDATVRAKRHGVHFGLGLDFVQRVAAAHGGAARLRDGDDGCGAVAELTLPYAMPV
jgi:signal transduction histidine kinase